MLLLDNLLAELTAGFERVRKAESALRYQWQPSLVHAYEQAQRAYEQAEAARLARAEALRPLVQRGINLAGGVGLVGLVLWMAQAYTRSQGLVKTIFSFLGPLVLAVGLSIAAGVGLMWFFQVIYKAPKAPANPMAAGIFEPLLPAWREGVRGEQLQAEIPEETAGEYALLSQLVKMTDGSYVAHRLRLKTGAEVHVVTAGPRGIWVFEVVPWRGHITFRNNQWVYAGQKAAGNGAEGGEAEEPAPEMRWQQAADEVLETLRRQLPYLLRRLPDLNRPRGGLVFSHPEAALHIPPDAPFRWGKVYDWGREINATQPMLGLSERVSLQIMDALLTRHRLLSKEQPSRSLAAYAAELVKDREARLSAWTKQKVVLLDTQSRGEAG